MTPERRPTVRLVHEDAKEYCDAVCSAVRGARLNQFFPNSKRTRSHIAAMSPSVHRGIYDDLEVDQESGLPTYKIWARVQADATIAPKQLAALGSRELLAAKAESHPDTVHVRQLAKWDYYDTLVNKHEIATLGDVSVKVRKLESGRGYFQVILDKFDVNGVFLRYLIELSQSFGNDQLIKVSEAEQLARHTEDLQGLVYKFAAVSSSSTFGKLSTINGINVERVHKGTIGPIFFPWSKNVPAMFQEVIEDVGWIATFSTDNAARDIDTSICNDPLSTLPTDGLDARFAFHCFRDRKFVTPRKSLSRLRDALGDARCITYGT